MVKMSSHSSRNGTTDTDGTSDSENEYEETRFMQHVWNLATEKDRIQDWRYKKLLGNKLVSRATASKVINKLVKQITVHSQQLDHHQDKLEYYFRGKIMEGICREKTETGARSMRELAGLVGPARIRRFGREIYGNTTQRGIIETYIDHHRTSLERDVWLIKHILTRQFGTAMVEDFEKEWKEARDQIGDITAISEGYIREPFDIDERFRQKKSANLGTDNIHNEENMRTVSKERRPYSKNRTRKATGMQDKSRE